MPFDQNEQALADAVQAENDRVTNVTRGEFDTLQQRVEQLYHATQQTITSVRQTIALAKSVDHPGNIRDIVKAFADNTFHNRTDVQERIRQAVDAYIDGCKRAKRL